MGRRRRAHAGARLSKVLLEGKTAVVSGAGGSIGGAVGIERSTLLGRAAALEDVGTVAAFVASDRARTMTAATVNVSAGALID